MKHSYLTILVTLLLSVTTNVNAASNIDLEVDGIKYILSDKDKTAQLREGSSDFTGDLVIPETISYNENSYRVIAILPQAYKNCTGLTSVIFPNGLTYIYGEAFAGCSGLMSVNIPNSFKGFRFNYGLNDYGHPFSGCDNLKSVTINCSKIISEDYTPVHSGEPGGLAGLFGNQIEEYIIGEGITEIGDCAFYRNNIKSITLPSTLKTIGSLAFAQCSGLREKGIFIPDNVTFIMKGALDYINNISATLGSDAMLAVWNAGYEVKGYSLPYFFIEKDKTTQTTITFHCTKQYDNVYTFGIPDSYTWEMVTEDIWNRSIKLTNLEPGRSYGRIPYLKGQEVTFYFPYYGLFDESTTKGLNMRFDLIGRTASSLTLSATHDDGDVVIIKEEIRDYPNITPPAKFMLTGLEPNYSETFLYRITIRLGDGTKVYALNPTFKTESLTLTPQSPKVISEGNVIVSATSNIDDEEEKVGFEWRRTDWSDDFESRTGTAYLYEGQMEGYIRSLNSNYLWKFRPYYESAYGNRYYGEWKGIDPADFSYFDPTVHTYARIDVQGNRALVRGYAQRGTDNITAQGFKYWKVAANVKSDALRVPSVPRDAMTAEGSGTVMEVELTGLDYGTTYHYAAYVTTSEGETFYGEEKTFQTGDDTTDIIDIPEQSSDAAALPSSSAIYDLSGRRLSAMRKGLNIVRSADGTIRKALMK